VDFKKAYKNWRAAKWFREKYGAAGTLEQKSLSSVLWSGSKHKNEIISKFVTSVIDPLTGEWFAPQVDISRTETSADDSSSRKSSISSRLSSSSNIQPQPAQPPANFRSGF
jgi:hypothetical protein